MKAPPPCFEHSATSVADIIDRIKSIGVDKAVLKVLPKNANDKNQAYILRNYTPLHAIFALTVTERGASTSKDCPKPGNNIPEAVFDEFHWVDSNGTLVKAKNVKVIVYTQYPEARLSGFLTVENTMPHSLSSTFTKANPKAKRLIVLGRTPGGGCVALMYLDLSEDLLREISVLPGLEGSRACKLLTIPQGYSEKLFSQLKNDVINQPHRGCRLGVQGNTLAFTGTQVCGYTLEHALGIIPNAGINGDLYGIELKAHTMPKVTLFTTEPDFGQYSENFEKFMTTYGYESTSGEWRVTGLHRADAPCAKTKLTLQVREYHAVDPEDAKSDWVRDEQGERKSYPYDPGTPLTGKMNAVEVVLVDDTGGVAAGWSLGRLMNNWGAKHNEVVYISADKTKSQSAEDIRLGFKYQVNFLPTVIWCRETSAERLLNAICAGTIFLDPGPKFVADKRSKNKRRCQWRVNNINKAAHVLYEHVALRDLNA